MRTNGRLIGSPFIKSSFVVFSTCTINSATVEIITDSGYITAQYQSNSTTKTEEKLSKALKTLQ